MSVIRSFTPLWQLCALETPNVFQAENLRMYYNETIRQMYDIGIGSSAHRFLISISLVRWPPYSFYQPDGWYTDPSVLHWLHRAGYDHHRAGTYHYPFGLAGKVGSNMAAELGACDKKNTSMPWKLWGQHLCLPGHASKIVAAIIVIPFWSVLPHWWAFWCLHRFRTHRPFSTADYIKGIRSFCALQCVYDVCQSRGFAYILTGVSCWGYFVRAASWPGEASTRAVGVQRYFKSSWQITSLP